MPTTKNHTTPGGDEDWTEAEVQGDCAGVGNGYWYCDLPGGCPDCRALATEAGDGAQLAAWKAEVQA